MFHSSWFQCSVIGDEYHHKSIWNFYLLYVYQSVFIRGLQSQHMQQTMKRAMHVPRQAIEWIMCVSRCSVFGVDL